MTVASSVWPFIQTRSAVMYQFLSCADCRQTIKTKSRHQIHKKKKQRDTEQRQSRNRKKRQSQRQRQNQKQKQKHCDQSNRGAHHMAKNC